MRQKARMRVGARRGHWPELEEGGIHPDVAQEHIPRSHAHRILT